MCRREEFDVSTTLRLRRVTFGATVGVMSIVAVGLAPAGAEPPPGATVTAPASVVQDQAFAISGTGCTRPDGDATDLVVSVDIVGEENNGVLAEAIDVAADGSWSEVVGAEDVRVRHERRAAFFVRCRDATTEVIFHYEPIRVRAMARPLEATLDASTGTLSVTNRCDAAGTPPNEVQVTYDLYLEALDGSRVQLAVAEDPFVNVPYGLTEHYPMPSDLPVGPYTVFMECQKPPITIDVPRTQYELDIVWEGTPAPVPVSPPADPVSDAADFTG
jgi:hypothetical protein